MGDDVELVDEADYHELNLGSGVDFDSARTTDDPAVDPNLAADGVGEPMLEDTTVIDRGGRPEQIIQFISINVCTISAFITIRLKQFSRFSHITLPVGWACGNLLTV
ncbi:hypothetical protein LOTGIDRAFT_161916 [Lottia gigantea]|uniref:Uncharacterized protein n=1 Tax=Lottia gigantea TaxID=225164 RepID=V4AIR1_LOTGI|nr:hypothetical protein LOTGIDRAFT_161916 [Lottia gigantea]ESO93351.1 hypothetical protein LOTGIDRAFT_161916 [Lottia gigantea]